LQRNFVFSLSPLGVCFPSFFSDLSFSYKLHSFSGETEFSSSWILSPTCFLPLAPTRGPFQLPFIFVSSRFPSLRILPHFFFQLPVAVAFIRHEPPPLSEHPASLLRFRTPFSIGPPNGSSLSFSLKAISAFYFFVLIQTKNVPTPPRPAT